MDQRKRFFNLLEHLSNQAEAGIGQTTDYLEDRDYDEMDDRTKTFVMEQLDHYMNILQFVSDYTEHHLQGRTADCPDDCEHGREY